MNYEPTDNPEKPTCCLCGKPLYGPDAPSAWIDDEDYGDVHTVCLEEVKPA